MAIEFNIQKTWTELKSFAVAKQLAYQYVEFDERYVVFLDENTIKYYCEIFKAGFEPFGLDATQNTADRVDFETNYKSTANTKYYLSVDLKGATFDSDRLKVDAQLSAGGTPQDMVITDPDIQSQQAAVDTSGRLLVSTQPVTPITSTPVGGTVDGSHSGAVTTFFVLDATKTTTIQRFICGGEGKKYTKVELYEDPNGTGVGMVLLAKGFIPEGGGNFSFDLNEEYVGNGTRRLAIIRTCSNATETFAKWSGFEV